MLKKLSNYLPRHSLRTLYKAFIRPHLDYADIIYDKPDNMNICNKINAALASTGAIRASSKEKLYQELGFEYLRSRRRLRKLCLFYKIVVNKSPNYLYNYVSKFFNPIKLEVMTNFFIYIAEQNIFANSSCF